MRVRAVLFAAVVLMLHAAAASAQVPQFADSLLRKQWIVASTERYAGTHTTTLHTDCDFESGRAAAILRASLVSTTTLLGTSSTRDQLDLAADIEYRIPSVLHPLLITEAVVTNAAAGDALIPGLNNTAAAFVGLGVRASDHDDYIGVAVGGAYNRHLNVTDVGAGLFGEAQGHFDLAGYELGVDGHVRWYNITPRRYAKVDGSAHISRRFDEGALLSADVFYDRTDADNYSKRPEDQIVRYGGLTYDALDGRSDGRLQVSTALTYPISGSLDLDLSGTVSNLLVTQVELSEGLPPLPRDPDPFRFERSDLSIAANAGLRWSLPTAESTLRLEYGTSEQRNAVDPNGNVSAVELERRRASNAIYDFVSDQLMLSSSMHARLSRHDTLEVSGSIAIYRYNTPSPQNFDDRDEQSIQAQARFARSFSPMLTFSIEAQVFLTHLVYLFGQNSNDNNRNRVFRLAPSVAYALGDDFRNQVYAEVLANYTEYDFEGRTQNIRGRSFRELHLRDSAAVALTSTLRLVALGDLRIAERGSFSWSQFAESPLERTRTEGLEGEIITSAYGGVRFGAGGRLWRVKNFRAEPRSTTLVPFSDRTSFGPTARFEADLSADTEVRLTGWWEHRFEDSRLVARLPILFLTVGVKL